MKPISTKLTTNITLEQVKKATPPEGWYELFSKYETIKENVPPEWIIKLTIFGATIQNIDGPLVCGDEVSLDLGGDRGTSTISGIQRIILKPSKKHKIKRQHEDLRDMCADVGKHIFREKLLSIQAKLPEMHTCEVFPKFTMCSDGEKISDFFDRLIDISEGSKNGKK